MNLPPLTVADVKSATAGVPAMLAALQRVARGTANLDDADTIGQDLLSGFAFVDPPAAPAIALAKFALNLFVAANDAGLIHVEPDPLPMTDAQTTESPHSGRRG